MGQGDQASNKKRFLTTDPTSPPTSQKATKARKATKATKAQKAQKATKDRFHGLSRMKTMEWSLWF